MSVVDELVRSREAFERREWAAAHDRLSAVEPSRLSQDDLGTARHGRLSLGR